MMDSSTMAKFAKGFTNHEQTDPSGLIYMQARFYAPMYGRFLSPDPARDQHFEETQSWNIYSYVRNNPTMSIDPDGMQATSTGGAMTYYYLVQGGMSPEQAKRVMQDQNNGKAKGAVAGMTVNAGVGIMARLLTALGLNEARNPGSTAAALKGVQQEAQAISSEATTVIGHYPEYVAKASELGTRPFSVPMEVWNKMSSAEQWGANQKFLDRAIARGNSFSLATPLDKVKPGSFYAREIKYLMSKGYELSKDGLRLVKKATEKK